MTPFETDRLFFRPLTWADLDNLHDLYLRSDIMKYISGRPCTFSQTKNLLASHIADHTQSGFGLCATILKLNKCMIGRCGLIPISRDSCLEGDIAWMFHKIYWNQGLATEFASKMFQIGFEQLNLKRIQATAASLNHASIRVMQKVGMQFVKEDDSGVEYEIFPHSISATYK